MSARQPEQIDELFAQALNAGDLDALMALYEPEAALLPMPDKVVVGTAAIRESPAEFLAGKPKIALTPRLVARTGEWALITSRWHLSVTGPDGKPAEMNGDSIEVVRRQSDGSWRFVIDTPWGTQTHG